MSDRHVRRPGSDYGTAFLALLPQGSAWPRKLGSTLDLACRGLAQYWGDVDRRAADLLEQESDPRLTIELLPDWERAWGLPDPCYSEPQTIGERQQALIMRMTMLGSQSRQFFIDVAAQIGYSISITEYRTFVVGIDRIGDSRVYGELPPDPMRNEWGNPIMDARGDHPVTDGELSGWPHYGLGPATNRFYWTVHVDDAKLVWFRVGAGGGQTGIDPHLRIGTADDLECLLERWKPAHSEIIFDYSGILPPKITLSAFTVAENAPVGTVVGALIAENKFTGTPVFSLSYDAGGRFAVSGHDLIVAGPLDFETAATHTVTVDVSGIDPPAPSETFDIAVTDVVEPAWMTAFAMPLTDNVVGVLAGYNLRQSILAGYFPPEDGTKFRLTLQAGIGAEGARIDNLYAGHAAAGVLYNFDGTQTQIRVGGLTAFTIPAGGTVVTDPVDYAFDPKKNFLLAMHFDNGANDQVRVRSGLSGMQHWSKAGASEAGNTTISGYNTTTSYLFLVSKIEIWTNPATGE